MEEKKKKRIAWNKGKKGLQVGWNKGRVGVWSEETLKKNREAHLGEKSPAWKGGVCRDIKYVNWQKNLWQKRKKEATGRHSFVEWEELKARYDWRCPCCGKREPEIKLTQDHITPLSRGGSNNIENIQPLCGKCNCSKHTKTIKY